MGRTWLPNTYNADIRPTPLTVYAVTEQNNVQMVTLWCPKWLKLQIDRISLRQCAGYVARYRLRLPFHPLLFFWSSTAAT